MISFLFAQRSLVEALCRDIFDIVMHEQRSLHCIACRFFYEAFELLLQGNVPWLSDLLPLFNRNRKGVAVTNSYDGMFKRFFQLEMV